MESGIVNRYLIFLFEADTILLHFNALILQKQEK
jgi:hypothetical protein